MKYTYKISLLSILCLSSIFISGQAFAYQNPVVDAGPDLYVTSGMFNASPSAVLQGSATDPNNGTLTFHWSCTNGSISNQSLPMPLFTAPSQIWWNDTYTCTLTATNNYGLSAFDSTTVYVNYNNNSNVSKISVETNGVTTNSNAQAVLNATVTGNNYSYGTVTGWFQWGTTTSYGYESAHRAVAPGHFDQHIAELLPNTTYHYRAVIQGSSDPIYGQDMTFNSSAYSSPITSYNGGQVLGVSTISTGLTNNILTDSFFFPLMIIVLGIWLYFSGSAYKFADWLRA